MLDIDDAIVSTTKIEPSKLSLGESEKGPHTATLTIENDAQAAVTYQLSHATALATGAATFTPSFFVAPATVTFDPASVTVPAGGTALVNVTIADPATLADRGQYGGYVVLTPEGGGATYRVPFAGFKGDYQSIPVLTATLNGFPRLAKRSGGSFVNHPAGASFTFAGGDIPYLLLHFDHQSSRLRFEVTEVATGKLWHRALELRHVPRNSAASAQNHFFAFPWDGTTAAGNKVYTVPNGQSVITVTVLRALGNDANPAHVETWTSPVITVARP